MANTERTWTDELTPEERRWLEETPVVDDLAEDETEVIVGIPTKPKGPCRERSTT